MDRVPTQRFWLLVGGLWAALAITTVLVVGFIYPPSSVGAARATSDNIDPAAAAIWLRAEQQMTSQGTVFYPAYASMLQVNLRGPTLSLRLTAPPDADEDLFFLAAEVFPAVASAAEHSNATQLTRIELSGAQLSGGEVVFFIEGSAAIGALARGEQDVYQVMRGENR